MNENSNITKEEIAETEKSQFDRIREGARELPTGLPDGKLFDKGLFSDQEIDLIMKPTVRIERDRYEELIRKEALLGVVIRATKHIKYSSDLAETIEWILSDIYEDEFAGEDDGEE